MKDSEKVDRNVDAKAIIEAVLSHVGMRAPSFAKAIGINYQRIFDLQSGRTKKFNPGVVNLICERFPEINKMYLYTGQGSITNDQQDVMPHIPGSGPTSQLAEMLSMQHKLMQMFQSLQERESKLQEKSDKLTELERDLNDRETELYKREQELERLLAESGLKKDTDRLEA